MATTWMKALHRSGGSIAAALDRSVDYVEKSEKTNDGELVDSYECDPFTAQSEFLLSKQLYAQKTGRDQGKHDVIAYHIRMSFPHGEITSEKALELGRELAMRWTRGKHQFVVAAHTNTKNPHCHIVYNSVNLEHDGKYQDFKGSAFALRRVSDQICLEHGLSIIDKPGKSKGYNRAEYLGENKAPTVRDQLRDNIDTALSSCSDFNSFLSGMQAVGCEAKQGKHLAFKLPNGKKFIRCNSLGDDYSADAILERISGKRVVEPRQKTPSPIINNNRPNLLVDIQAKLREGKGAGYEHGATVFNLKQSSKTLLFLHENKIDSYDELVQKSAAVSSEYHGRTKIIKEVEARLKEITELQKYIGQYGKTREVYARYRESKWSQEFYDIHTGDILLHRAAKKYFDGLNLKKLPSINSLKQEFAVLAAEKKKLYVGYSELQDNHRALLTAKNNAERMLGIGENSPGRDSSQRKYSHDR